MASSSRVDPVALARALSRQQTGEDHDRALIVERLAWTPEQRLAANAAFLRFYWSVRPEGPLVRDEQHAVLRAEEIFATLERHQVLYVLIGGMAAVLHGSPLPTVDIDVCPSTRPENLERLARALEELQARIRTPDTPEGVRFPYEARFLATVALLNLVTRAGDLDLSFTPAGTSGYDDLLAGAGRVIVEGVHVPVASLEDVIRSKTAANRPKDRRALPVLHQLLDEIRRR